jgi:hypothetical protein|tara:strand:+ start:667 stop:801 length:135 start_codon:yes stop_codon:yes gene_type:complete
VSADLLFAESELEDFADSDLDDEDLDVLDVSSFCDLLFELEPDP